MASSHFDQDWPENPDSRRTASSIGAQITRGSLHAAMSKTLTAEEAVELNPDFSFDLLGDPYSDFLDNRLDVQDLVEKDSKLVR